MQDSGLCQCGCGNATVISKNTDKSKGWIKGVPRKFLVGHNLSANPQQMAAHYAWNGGRRIGRNGYVVIATGVNICQYEHILVAELALGRPLKQLSKGHSDNEVVHHIDGDKKNNAKSNLLICSHAYHAKLHTQLEQSDRWPEFPKRTKQPNGTSRTGASGFKGVSFYKKSGKWKSEMASKCGKRVFGYFTTPEDAARKYDEEVVKLLGDKWITNKSMGLIA